MKAWHYMTEQDVKNLAEEALNEACRHIQDVIGVESGDLASMFFSGKNQDLIQEILSRYIESELTFKNPELHNFESVA